MSKKQFRYTPKSTEHEDNQLTTSKVEFGKTQPINDSAGFYERERPAELLKPMHIDEFLDEVKWIADDPELNYVHFMLTYFRMPGIDKLRGSKFMSRFKLFVTFEGERWRVTGASRLGDIWLSKHFMQEHGYDRRVDFDLSKLTDWNNRP